jgi:rod shape determining protein RodA
MVNRETILLNRELLLPFIALVILSIGLTTVSSVASPDVFQKQVMGAGLALVPIGLLLWLGRPRLYNLAIPLYVASLVMLLLTMFVGTEVNGNRNWLGQGFFRFQPLEFGKIALILTLARVMPRPFRALRDYLPVAAISLPMLALVMVGTGDLGGALVLIAIIVGMVVARGVPWVHLVTGLVLVAVAVPTVIWPQLKPYQQKRLTIFVNPETDPRGQGYQLIQSRIAIGSGGLTGKGYKLGTQSQGNFVPADDTDFIFAPWAEEWGFVGATVLILAYGALFWRMAGMGGECPSETDRMVIGGVMAMLGFQVLENLGAAIGLAPLTGLTLPLVSYGVSSLLAVSVALGVVYVVHRDRFRDFG